MISKPGITIKTIRKELDKVISAVSIQQRRIYTMAQRKIRICRENGIFVDECGFNNQIWHCFGRSHKGIRLKPFLPKKIGSSVSLSS